MHDAWIKVLVHGMHLDKRALEVKSGNVLLLFYWARDVSALVAENASLHLYGCIFAHFKCYCQYYPFSICDYITLLFLFQLQR